MDRKQTAKNKNHIGKIIAEARKAAGLSQDQVAELLEVDRRTVSAYEQGRRRIHASALFLIAKALNLSLDDLINQKFTRIDGRTRFSHAMKDLEQLPEKDQKAVFTMIDSLSKKAAAK